MPLRRKPIRYICYACQVTGTDVNPEKIEPACWSCGEPAEPYPEPVMSGLGYIAAAYQRILENRNVPS